MLYLRKETCLLIQSAIISTEQQNYLLAPVIWSNHGFSEDCGWFCIDYSHFSNSKSNTVTVHLRLFAEYY